MTAWVGRPGVAQGLVAPLAVVERVVLVLAPAVAVAVVVGQLAAGLVVLVLVESGRVGGLAAGSVGAAQGGREQRATHVLPAVREHS